MVHMVAGDYPTDLKFLKAVYQIYTARISIERKRTAKRQELRRHPPLKTIA